MGRVRWRSNLTSVEIRLGALGGFLAVVVGRAAGVGASYRGAGFVHGVLNTDNIKSTGGSFDYGP